MKTNSPNPVDGDVQELIADCQAEIVELEKRLTTWDEAWIPYLQSKLKRQQVALAALTAEPVEYQYYYHNHGTGAGKWLPVTNRVAFEKMKVMHSDDGDFSFRELYTAPPAQILRPVELTDCEFGAVSHMSGGSKDYCNGFVDGINNAIKAIRKAGGEVKS